MSGPKPQQLALKINGLWTDPNTLSEVPSGVTLATADNVVLDRDSILQSRRGITQYGSAPSSTNVQTTIIDYKDVLMVFGANGVLRRDTNGNGALWNSLTGTYTPASGSRVKSTQSNSNLYMAMSTGIIKIDTPSSTPIPAGAPAGLGGVGSTTGSAGFFQTAKNVAYRVIWGYRDANNNLILGAPGDRIIVSNTSGGDRNVSLTFYVPPRVVANTWFYQVYRSSQSETLADEPDDDLQLVFDGIPTSGQVTAKTVTITDVTPDNLRGVTIYTAPSINRNGILDANTEPPFATQLATFNNVTFYGNTRTRHSLTINVIAVGSPSGVQVTDTITVTAGANVFTLTGGASEVPATGTFRVETGLTPAENIERTARSIVTVINLWASNTSVNAYYTSGFEDIPGTITITRNSVDATAFSIVSNRGGAFRPVLPASGTNFNNTSRNDVAINRVYYSKLQQPEAVPLLQFFDIGSAEEPIQALVPLRTGLMVLKTDGIFRITGTNQSFAVEAVDTTVRIIAPDTVALLGNRVWFFASQGVVAASDNGVELMSRAIESDLLALSSNLYPNFRTVAFATGYESDRKYLLYMQTTSEDTISTQTFVYNTVTAAWTRWTRSAAAALVKQSDDKLYITGPVTGSSSQFVQQERKNFSLTDFADEQYNITVVSSSGNLLTINSSTLPQVDYTIRQGVVQSRVVEVVSDTVLRLSTVEDFTAGTAQLFRPIFTSAVTNPFDAAQPAMMKHWADCSLLFRTTDFERLIIGFAADTTGEELRIFVVPPRGVGGWGTFPWGLRPWGISQSARARLRAAVPKAAMRSNWISIKIENYEAFADLNLAGISLTFSPMSSRQKGSSRE